MLKNKKRIILVILLGLFITGCSKDEETKDKPIIDEAFREEREVFQNYSWVDSTDENFSAMITTTSPLRPNFTVLENRNIVTKRGDYYVVDGKMHQCENKGGGIVNNTFVDEIETFEVVIV